MLTEEIDEKDLKLLDAIGNSHFEMKKRNSKDKKN